MAADRAINLALRVLGIGEVERDFKRVGGAGEKAFAEVKRSANGAAQEVSEYTARLRRAVQEANRLARNIPQLNKPTAQSRADRGQFVLGAVGAEKERMLKGLPDTIGDLKGATSAAEGFGMSMSRAGAIGAVFGAVLVGIGAGASASLEAFQEHERAIDAFEASLSLAGNRTKATSADIRAMADVIVDSTNQTEENALRGAQALAQVSGLSRAAFEEAMIASAKFADAMGKDLPDVLQSTTIPVLQALAQRDMKALVAATADLDRGLGVAILQMAEAGRTADAQRALFHGLADAAGDGPNGASRAANHLEKAWGGLKAALGENIAATAAPLLDFLARKLDSVTDRLRQLRSEGRGLIAGGMNFFNPEAFIDVGRRRTKGGRGGGHATAGERGSMGIGGGYDPKAESTYRDFERRYGGSKKKRGGGGSGRKGPDLAAEAKQAEDAAQRIEDANTKVVDSWKQRVADIEARVGLEGEALKAVERQQKVEAAVRQLNVEFIEKEVEAARKRAAANKTQFDAAKATAAATAALATQKDAVRDLAERFADAEEAVAAFNRRQGEARSVLEGLKTPVDRVNDAIEQAIGLLKQGDLSADQFNARMHQLAYDMADARHEMDAGAKAWEGFGQDVARSLTDIALNGGSALDVLQTLIRLPLERLWEQNFTNPLADWIDGLTGNNRDKNAAAVKVPNAAKILGSSPIVGGGDSLPGASDVAATSVSMLGSNADVASAALANFATSLGNQFGGLGIQADAVATGEKAHAEALGQVVPLTGQFGGALGQLIAQLSGGGGGGGSIGQLVGLGLNLLGGSGLGSTAARLAPDVASTFAANPGLFAAGTDSVPVGKAFYVGDNGRELMRYHGGGRLEVVSGPRTHREAQSGGGVTIVQHVNVPERADPRRTASGIARSTQGALMRSARKGLAPGPRG